MMQDITIKLCSCGHSATFRGEEWRSVAFLICSQCGRRQRAIEMRFAGGNYANPKEPSAQSDNPTKRLRRRALQPVTVSDNVTD